MPSTIVLFLLACQSGDSADTTPKDTDVTGAAELPGTAHMGSVARNTAPSTADVATLGDQNVEFGLDLLRATVGADNVVISPWSLQVVMAQVYAGATGTTKTTLADGMRWTLPEAAFHEAMNATSLAVDGHTDAAAEEPITVQTTNQVFVTSGYPLGATWLDVLSENYGTGVQEMDFAADPVGVADDINAWIHDRTGGHIENLITPQLVEDSRMLLVNALFFKASWAVPFGEDRTADGDFTLLDGSTVTAPIMNGSMNLRGAAGDGFFAVELPYTDQGLAMTVVLPDAGRFAEVAAGLDFATLSPVLDSMEQCSECSISMPSFTYDSHPDMMSALDTLGLTPIFGGTYGEISDSLTLTMIDQMAFVAVNEKGTEAAAATVASFSDSASIPPFGPVEIDRPFLYFVRDVDSGTLLFAGAVVDPR